ncbi:Cyclin G-associated kinase [Actinoplanes sp. SE50]|uniref:Cyclin G-associated kinase n=1 Tax=unclassified Actinoplanes TaxID=2626549 RepID=UPI00023EDF86|nr:MULTISPECIES: Cyclin G-associated kinase [unclassified Actinoplanes]AEV88888.1 Cyclin G-associated kinase [Actinoplanes sp. SE50/110]ATO87294.1 Cyclin G-associated kinase [Actinoplanes sp. SE50]SLM04712.1 hypothetical protein ACSP50_8019 [Actinoplanes sp. SE50/110]
MRKLWYAGAIAGGLLFILGATGPALADPASPVGGPVDDVLSRTNGLRLSSPIGSDPLGRAPLLTLSQDNQQLFQVKPGQNSIGRSPEEKAGGALPAADVIGGGIHNHPGDRFGGSLKGVPLTDTNTGAVRLPLLGGGRLPIISGILPDGSHTVESASRQYPLLDDLDGDLSVRGLPRRLPTTNRANLAGLPLGGSPVAPADLLPESSRPKHPASVAPSASPEPTMSASVDPSMSPSVIPSGSLASNVDDPRLLQEPIDIPSAD